MNTNHNKIKSQFCYVSTTGPTSGSASLPDGSKMKSNSHLKLTSTRKQNTPWCKITKLNYRHFFTSNFLKFARFGKPVQCGVDLICSKHHNCKTSPPYQAICGDPKHIILQKYTPTVQYCNGTCKINSKLHSSIHILSNFFLHFLT